jgi:hypothetical protein
MDILYKIVGPKSKYNNTIPYTYMARVSIIQGNKELYNYYYADTICGLIEYLDDKNLKPAECEIFGVYFKIEIPLKIKYCTDSHGVWLKKPFICSALEHHFQDTMEEAYKGHVASGPCLFEDRDTQGSGPY